MGRSPMARHLRRRSPLRKLVVFQVSVERDLSYAEIFRKLLQLKALGNPKKLAAYFESKGQLALLGRFGEAGTVGLVPDLNTGVRFRISPENLLGALWYQIGLKLSDAALRMCPVCHCVFEVGIGTGLRADAKFCCHAHKVEFFNRNRSGQSRRSKERRK